MFAVIMHYPSDEKVDIPPRKAQAGPCNAGEGTIQTLQHWGSLTIERFLQNDQQGGSAMPTLRSDLRSISAVREPRIA